MTKFLRILPFLLCLFTVNLKSQVNFSWAKQFTGSANSDRGMAVTSDAAGNVYSTGSFQGTVDFDPGSGTFTLMATGGADIFVSKLDAGGNFVWARSFA